MQMRHDSSRLGHGVNQIVTCFGRFKTAEAHAKVARHAIEFPQQVPEPTPIRFRLSLAQIDSVMPEVDAGQHDLVIAVRNQVRYLGDDFFYRPAADYGPDGRDDAVAAIEEAAVLHLDERPLVIVKARDARGHRRDAELAQLVLQFALIGDDTTHARQLRHGPRIASRITTHDDDVGLWIALVQTPHRRAALGVPFHRHGAGVDDAQIRRLAVIGLAIAVDLERFLDVLRLVLVD